MESSAQTNKRYESQDRKKRAVMAYLSAMGHGDDFDSAVHKWMAGMPSDAIAGHKPLRHDGSINASQAIAAIFDEIDNVDVTGNPKLANAVQKAYRIQRGKSMQQGDDAEFDKTHAYEDQADAEAAYTGHGPDGKQLSNAAYADVMKRAPNPTGVGAR